MSNQEPYLLALHRSMFLTFRRYTVLRSKYKQDWQYVWEKASYKELVAIGLDKNGIEKLVKGRKKVVPEHEVLRLQKAKSRMVCIGEDGYPQGLMQTHNPPVLLFLRGDENIPLEGGLAIVGSRKITIYGKRIIRTFLPPLLSYNIPIVSGFALGVDIEAHKETVQGGGVTIGVLANGIDHVCPKSHQTFADKILKEKKGLFVSEYLPGIEPRPEYFPVRNRIIAGLSKAILIVEATEKSGTLITAQLGLEQGKDVLAIPGDIFSSQSKGPNTLLSTGSAALVRDPEDIVQMMNLQAHKRQQELALYVPENVPEASIIELLQQGTCHMDDIIRSLPHEKMTLLATLTLLEMKGVVCHVGAQKYSLG